VARRRVFRVKVECTGIVSDLSITANRFALFGRPVLFEKADGGSIALRLDGAIIGHLDDPLGTQVMTALDRGQAFTAKIENAYQNYDRRLKPTTARLDLKVGYFLEKDQPPIVVPKPFHQSEPAPKSFFTKVAGISFRQDVASRCRTGDPLILVREPDNPKDEGAIKILRDNGEHVGYVPAHVSRNGDRSGLAYQMDRGDQLLCRVKDVTGGFGKTIGINVEITDGDDFYDGEDILPAAHTRPTVAQDNWRANSQPTSSSHAWLVVIGIAALVFIIALIAHNS